MIFEKVIEKLVFSVAVSLAQICCTLAWEEHITDHLQTKVYFKDCMLKFKEASPLCLFP